MGDTDTNPTAERNRETACGLRELADFLDDHADELPALNGRASEWIFSGEPALVRATLESTARALGDRATERLHGSEVVIEGKFTGGVHLAVSASVKLLRDAPPEPEPPYRPIIGEES